MTKKDQLISLYQRPDSQATFFRKEREQREPR
jgi:hypothetical protein